MSYPRRRLTELIAEHGQALANDPRRVESLLLADCPDQEREVQVLVRAVELQVVAELQAGSSTLTWRELAEPLVARLAVDGRVSESEAWAAVETWVRALGLAVASAPFDSLQSLQEVERRQEEEEADNRRRAGRAGRRRGLVTGLFIGSAYQFLWWFMELRPGRHPNLVRPLEESKDFDVLLLLPPLLCGLAGWCLGWQIGPRVGRTNVPLAGLLTGAIVGLACGLIYLQTVGKFLAPVIPDADALALLSPLIGLIGGGMVGLLIDHRPQADDNPGQVEEPLDE